MLNNERLLLTKANKCWYVRDLSLKVLLGVMLRWSQSNDLQWESIYHNLLQWFSNFIFNIIAQWKHLNENTFNELFWKYETKYKRTKRL
jgi:hypothetical protein